MHSIIGSFSSNVKRSIKQLEKLCYTQLNNRNHRKHQRHRSQRSILILHTNIQDGTKKFYTNHQTLTKKAYPDKSQLCGMTFEILSSSDPAVSVRSTLKFPPHLKLVATLPCEIPGTF